MSQDARPLALAITLGGVLGVGLLVVLVPWRPAAVEVALFFSTTLCLSTSLPLLARPPKA